MYSPRSEASDESHSSDATLLDSVRDSLFASAFANSFTFRSLPHPTGSTYSCASSRLPDGNGDAVIPNFTHPYLTEPVNPRESGSYRRHVDSVLFPIPPSNVYSPAQSQAPPSTHHSAITERQAQQHNQPSPGHYVQPYINPVPVDYLNCRRPRRSVSYKDTTQASLYDLNQENARRKASDALKARRLEDPAVSPHYSGLMGCQPDESEERPIYPPVYPQSVLPADAFEYPIDRDGAWQVNEPVTIIRQERTRTVKAQYTPEVVRIDERSDGRGSVDEYRRSVPDRTQGGNTPHPHAVHHQFISTTEERYHRHGRKHHVEQGSQQGQLEPAETRFYDGCKVRKLDITENRYSTWMKGRVIRTFYVDPVDGVDASYYHSVEFDHPTLGRQKGYFFENRKEIKFKKQ